MAKYTKTALAVFGGLALLSGLGYVTSRRDEGPRHSVKQNVRAAQSRPPINIDARFRAYRPNPVYDEFMAGSGMRFGSVDLNDDGTAEGLYMATNQERQSAVYVVGVINGESRSLLSDARLTRLGREKTNGYYNLFGSGVMQLPRGGQANAIVKYAFDGSGYKEAGKIADPERAETIARHMTYALSADRNPESRRQFLLDMEQTIGTHDTLTSMLFAQSMMGGRQRVPMPTDIDYENYVRVYYEETGVDLSSKSPEEVERILFSHALDPMVMDPTEPIVLAGIFGKRLAEEFGFGEYDQHLDRIKKSGGSLAGKIESFERFKKRKPDRYELSDLMLYNTIMYDNTRERARDTNSDNATTRTWSSGGQSGSTTTIRPFATEDNQRRWNMEDRARQNTQRTRENAQRIGGQMDQQAKAAAGRAAQEAGKAADGAKKAIDDMLKPKKDKP